MENGLKYLSLFSGIGSPEMALRDLGIDYDLIGFSEIDTKAIKSYCAIHKVSEDKNLGDITKVDIEALPIGFDLLTHGSPCQDFSFAGLKKGGDEESGTRSSLMWNTVEIVAHSKPKYVIWENVKGVLAKAHIHNYNKYLDKMNELGYNNYSKLINSKDFGVAQSRERLFVVSIRKDIDNNTFEFPKPYSYNVVLRDILDDEVDEKYYTKKVLNPRRTKNYIQYDNSGKGYNSQGARLYYLDTQMCTLTKSSGGDKTKVLLDESTMKARRLTPKEAWRVMGFSDEDYEVAKADEYQSDSSLYSQAGNSIVLPVIKEILRSLLNN